MYENILQKGIRVESVYELVPSSDNGIALRTVVNAVSTFLKGLNTRALSSWDIARCILFLIYVNYSLLPFFSSKFLQPLPLVSFSWLDEFPVMILHFANLFACIGLFGFYKRTWPYLLVVGTIVLECLTNYSNIAAFHQFIAIIAIYLVLFRNESEDQKILGARINLFLVMFSAAIYKMNPQFLAGSEFRDGGDFFIGMSNYLPGYLNSILPILIILIELLLALLSILGSSRVLVVYFLFPLSLTFHGPLFAFSALIFLPFFCICCFEVNRLSFRDQVLFLILVLLVSTSCFYLYRTWGEAGHYGAVSIFVQSVYLFAVWATIYLGILGREYVFKKSVKVFFKPRAVVWAILLILYLLSGHLNLIPPPHGASMYSGRNSFRYKLVVSGETNCKRILDRYSLTSWSTKYNLTERGRCEIYHFYRSPLEYLNTRLLAGQFQIAEVGKERR